MIFPPVPDLSQCPYPLGTTAAKIWWKTVVIPKAKAAATPQAKALYGSKLKGAYLGRPLRPGPHPHDGDFQFVVDSLRAQGYSEASAKSIAGKIANNLGNEGAI